jgi:hypothetical protein
MKVVKITKKHECSYCERIREVGTLMDFYKGRSGKYIVDGFDEKQIGIEYWKNYLCHDDPDCLITGQEL